MEKFKCRKDNIKLFEMGICLSLSQAEHAFGHLTKHFHEVEVGRSHGTTQAPPLFHINRQWHEVPSVTRQIHY